MLFYRIYENEKWAELDQEYPMKLPKCIDRYAMCSVGQKLYFVGGQFAFVDFFVFYGFFIYYDNIFFYVSIWFQAPR